MRSSPPPRRPSPSSRLTAEARDYWRFRRALQDLNSRMLKTVPPEVFREVGTLLRVFVDGCFVFPDEGGLSVLMDCCLHDWIDGEGRNLVARYAERVAGTRLPDAEQTVLDAMHGARYAHFRLEEMVPGVGARILSALDEREFTLVEPLLDHLPDGSGLWWVGRLMFPGGRCMTTGSPTLCGRSGIADPDEQLARVRRARPAWRSDGEMAIALARWALRVIADRSTPEDEVTIPEGDLPE